MDDLVSKKGRLDEAELNQLRHLLTALEGDVELFGAAGDDMQRIRSIRARIKREEANK